MSSTVSLFNTPLAPQQGLSAKVPDNQFNYIINFWSSLYRTITFYQLKESTFYYTWPRQIYQVKLSHWVTTATKISATRSRENTVESLSFFEVPLIQKVSTAWLLVWNITCVIHITITAYNTYISMKKY